MTRKEWLRLGGIVAVVVALHVLGWGALVGFVAPQHFSLGDRTLGIGVGFTAYVLGLRHAFDADHIAAIDNTTRKLMHDGQRPLSAGLFFSLGHSTVVFGLALLLSAGVKAVAGPVADDSSALHHYSGLIGAAVSGAFLYLIAIINLVVLVGILRAVRGLRSGRLDEAEVEHRLAGRGLVNRLLGPVMKAITRSWQMFPIGLLFGLGFDTATEVALLVLAGTGAAAGLPWYAILCLPILFAAGMSLLDTIDGTFMNLAYGWAFAQPLRTIYYNLTVTALSVAVALIVGTFELLGLIGAPANPGGVDSTLLGCLVIGVFAGTWVVALACWRFGRIEQRWTSGLREESAHASEGRE
ncbi:HoxN/HupN/NixA family nickel/cobalt transporter [Nocardia sp. CT2-14]|uniref:Nickel/cobalt efflux system n=1 Tax=Nocardia aurantiaca TaxID=2675850 RepID=A0A6I3L8Y1_9NOCA|nr:HoxN/HupN/NixA family nickel/cobalt transporter [Nocardia aurantiaca]